MKCGIRSAARNIHLLSGPQAAALMVSDALCGHWVIANS